MKKKQTNASSETGGSSSRHAPAAKKEFAPPIANHMPENSENDFTVQRSYNRPPSHGNATSNLPPDPTSFSNTQASNLNLQLQENHFPAPQAMLYGDRQNYIMHLHRTIGNDAVGHLWRTGQLQRRLGLAPLHRAPGVPALQAKLTIGPANDPYEQEADNVAERVTSMQEPRVPQRAADGTHQEDQDQKITRSPISGSITPLRRTPGKEESATVEPGVESSIQSARGGGKSLSEGERSYFEPRFGTDFSGVKIHTGGQANDLARSVNARAFTVGSDIFFAGGEYNPQTTEGKKLMAHELTHTVQQGGGLARKIQKQSFNQKEPKSNRHNEKNKYSTQNTVALINKIISFIDDFSGSFSDSSNLASINITECRLIAIQITNQRIYRLKFKYALGRKKTEVALSLSKQVIQFSFNSSTHQISGRKIIGGKANTDLQQVYEGLSTVYKSLYTGNTPPKLIVLQKIFTG